MSIAKADDEVRRRSNRDDESLEEDRSCRAGWRAVVEPPLWKNVNELLCEGKLGKVLMYQTEFFRNSIMGQWRYYKLNETMNPTNIDWKLWLGVEEGAG